MTRLSIFKNRKFVHLWTSQLLSQLTINIINFLIIVRLYERTGSAIASSFIWIAYATPAILIGPFAAASADLMDRRKMLMVTNLAQAVTIFAYSFLFGKYLFLSYGVVLIYSFFNQFYVPSEAATLPHVVEKEDLPQANSIFFLTQQAALVVGIGLAGFSNEIFGFMTSFILASILLFCAFVSVSFLPAMKPRQKIPVDLEKRAIEFFSSIMEGYRFIKNNSIVYPFFFLMALYVSIAMALINFPILASEVVKIKASYSGFVMMVPAGIGAVAGTFLVSRALAGGIRKRRVIEISLLTLGLSVFGLVFLVPMASVWIKIPLTVFIFLLLGGSFVGAFIPPLTYIQEATPGGLMGRVFGNFWFLTTAASVLPVLFSATLSEVFGVNMLFLAIGLFYLAALLVLKFYGDKIQTGYRA